MLELIIFLLFLQAESGNVVKVDMFFFAITRLRTNRTKQLVWDFARTIFVSFSFSRMIIVVVAVVLIHVIFRVFLVTKRCFKTKNVMPVLVLLLKRLSPLACSTQIVLTLFYIVYVRSTETLTS